MQVDNLHQRQLPGEIAEIGALIDSLATPHDRLWPRRLWPRMTFDRPLGVGAVGGHGPIRYVIEAYTPGESIRFRFTGPTGFDGFHSLEVDTDDAGQPVLRHSLHMQTHGMARIAWPLLYRPLHDALAEDALSNAQRALGLASTLRPWSPWVRLLRWLASGGKAPSQASIDPHTPA